MTLTRIILYGEILFVFLYGTDWAKIIVYVGILFSVPLRPIRHSYVVGVLLVHICVEMNTKLLLS